MVHISVPTILGKSNAQDVHREMRSWDLDGKFENAVLAVIFVVREGPCIDAPWRFELEVGLAVRANS